VTFQILLLGLASNQDAQRKAQAEVDAVFGPGNTLPDTIDLDQLPYINACVTEGLRWRPVSPLGLPRETLADQDVLGYHIPKGTMVLLNQWTIQQDPNFYDEPYEYRPERYLHDPLGAKPGVSQVGRKALYTFGAGRRECPGTDFFFQNIRIAVSQILWAFNIEGDGPLDTGVDTAFVSSVMLRPKPFKLKFVPRRARIPETLLEEKGKADIAFNEILS
jgi:cytochrome P450